LICFGGGHIKTHALDIDFFWGANTKPHALDIDLFWWAPIKTHALDIDLIGGGGTSNRMRWTLIKRGEATKNRKARM
jgi:hypothetical protein